ncbi:MAG: hypothetical protein WAY88_02640, partial [Minisyncoccia bacterium]
YACESTCGDWDLGGDDNSVYIKVSNDGYISNTTSAKADTGDNKAGGSYGGDAENAGDGGNGGDASVDGGVQWCGECGSGSGSTATGGEGGNGGNSNGGNAGDGGYVVTGDASAEAGTANSLNSTDVEVEGCGCDEDQNECSCIPPWFRRDVDNSVKIKVYNDGYISNETKAKADTGDNKAKGSYGGDAGYGGDGGDGGEAEVGDEEEGCGCEWDLGGSAGEAVGGDGGNGGHSNGGEGGQGGTISTGEARSEAGTINMMNTTVIRVVR